MSAKIEIDLKELQQRGEQEIELLVAELAGAEGRQGPDFPGRFVASGKTVAPEPGLQRRFIASGKAGASGPAWQRRFLASGKTPAPLR